jgi:hypothetical protein
MGIEVVSDRPEVPRVKCPGCKRLMEMDIAPFQHHGITKPLRSNCPFCGMELFCALLILVDTKLDHLYLNIASIVSIANPENLHLSGETGKEA